jgi:hypothetical protein
VSWCELETKNEARGRKFGLGSGRHFLKGVAAWSGGWGGPIWGARHTADVGEGPGAAWGGGS